MGKSKVRVEVSGVSTISFINSIREKGICLIDYYYSKSIVYVIIYYKDLSTLIAHSKEMCYNVKVIEYIGLVSLVRAIKGNLIISFGILVVVLALFLINSYIINIEIEAFSESAKVEAYELLKDNGINVFCKKSKIDLDYLENCLSSNVNRAEYAYISVVGSKLYVNITEETVSEVDINYSLPADIVATHSGVITSITTIQGNALVKVGDYVEEGQILIKGERVFLDGSVESVCAMGKIEARVSKSQTIQFDGYKQVKKLSGRVFDLTRIRIFKFERSSQSVPFDEYEIAVKAIYLSPFPLIVENVRVYELVNHTIPCDFSEVEMEYYDACMAKITSEIDFEIVDIEKVLEENLYTVSVFGNKEIGKTVQIT